ncbi:MAG TPA: MMPL family transporter [Polyangia bacterium]|nr:MMPL family transporter [Polyangia bacterium]
MPAEAPKPTAGVRWARWTARRRWAILAGALLVGAVAAPLAAHLPLYGDLSYLLPPDTRSVRDLHALESRAQVFGTVIVAVESDDPARRQAAAALVRDRLRALPPRLLIGVDYDSGARDRFAWAHRYLLAPADQLRGVRDELAARKARLNPLYVSLDDDADDKDAPPIGDRLRALKRQMDAAQAGAEHPAPILSGDGRLQLVVARTRFPADEISRNVAVVAAAEQAAAEARRLGGPAVRIGITGDVANAAQEHQALLGGMVRATVFTTGIVALGLLLFFGAAAPVAALLGALTVGALVTFAFATFSIGHLNLATAFLAPIVVGNGINFGIILLARFFEERRRADDPDDLISALGAAVQGSFGGTLAAALTASVSYASLLTTQFRGFRHFGVIGGVGILCCWAATFLILPAALAALAGRGLGRGRSPARMGRGLASLVPCRRPVVVGVTALVLVGSIGGAAHYLAGRPFEKDFNNLRSTGPAMRETLRWNAEIDRAFGRGISGGTVIALPTRARAREVAARLRAADAGKPDKQRLFARVTSLDDLVPPDQDDKLAVLADIRRLLTPATLASLSPADRELARALDPPAHLAAIADAEVPAELGWPFTEQDGTRGRLLVAKTGAGFDLWRTEDLERFVGRFRALGLGSDLVVGGNAFVQHDIVGSVDRDGPRATVVAALGAVLVVLAVLGMTRQAAVTVGCGAAGVALLLTAAGLFGIRINFLDFVALPITIGIGIDYAVNVAARHRAEGRGSAARILTATGPAVALCSFTTVVGYASLLFSANQGIRSFGLSALIGELTCVFAALVLAPALLDLRLRRRRAPAVTEIAGEPFVSGAVARM